jgi:hypothetical protein
LIIRPIRLVPSGANATDHATHGHKQIQASRKVLDEPGVGGVASDDVIEQGLGEGREDEAAKNGSSASTASCLRSCAPSSPALRSCSASCWPSAYQRVQGTEPGPALRLLRHAPEHGGRARPAAGSLRLSPAALPRRRQGRDGPQRALGRRSPGRAPSRWPSLACCTSSPTWSPPPKPRSRSRWVLRADRVALVGDRAVSQGPRARRGQAGLSRWVVHDIAALTLASHLRDLGSHTA